MIEVGVPGNCTDPIAGHMVGVRGGRAWRLSAARTRLPQETRALAMGVGESWASRQAVLHVLPSDCQQMSAHPSERNTSWMSARLSGPVDSCECWRATESLPRIAGATSNRRPPLSSLKRVL
jgi:hypothetical protein